MQTIQYERNLTQGQIWGPRDDQTEYSVDMDLRYMLAKHFTMIGRPIYKNKQVEMIVKIFYLTVLSFLFGMEHSHTILVFLTGYLSPDYVLQFNNRYFGLFVCHKIFVKAD